MHSLYSLAALLAACTLHQVGAINEECVPAKPYSDDTYVYYDQSSHCADAGVATSCCIIFVEGDESAGCAVQKWTQQDEIDVVGAMQDQLKKSGQFASSSSGHWTATYGLLTTAFPHQGIKSEFAKGLQLFTDNPTKWFPGRIYFQADGNVMAVDKNCE